MTTHLQNVHHNLTYFYEIIHLNLNEISVKRRAHSRNANDIHNTTALYFKIKHFVIATLILCNFNIHIYSLSFFAVLPSIWGEYYPGRSVQHIFFIFTAGCPSWHQHSPIQGLGKGAPWNNRILRTTSTDMYLLEEPPPKKAIKKVVQWAERGCINFT